jgi:hypothetical protein
MWGPRFPVPFPEASCRARTDHEGSRLLQSILRSSFFLDEIGSLLPSLFVYISPPVPSSLSGEPPTPPHRAFTLTLLPHHGSGAAAGGSGMALSSFVFHYPAMVVGWATAGGSGVSISFSFVFHYPVMVVRGLCIPLRLTAELEQGKPSTESR